MKSPAFTDSRGHASQTRQTVRRLPGSNEDGANIPEEAKVSRGLSVVYGGLVAVLLGGVAGCGPAPARAEQNAAASGAAQSPATSALQPPKSPEVSTLRLTGTVEAVRASTVVVPRLAGQSSNTLVITRMVTAGTRVSPGDVLVEFDPQDQVRNAMDRRAEVVDLDGQIQKKRSEQAIARSADETAVAEASHDQDRARLDLAKNDFVAPVEAEKNQLAFEQASAKLAQLRETAALKLKAADADLKILEIRRERSARALQYAEGNAKLMTVRAEFAGVVVIKSIYKGNGLSEVQEGDEVRPGTPILDIVDPTAMRVRARVNQADIGLLSPGLPALVRLDAYPELSFKGRVDIVSPLGVTSSLTPTVHTFVALISIDGMHARLMPDLTASVDVQP
jgi:multidrug resistance efflux pump